MGLKLFNFDRLKKYILIRASFFVLDDVKTEIWAAPKVLGKAREIDYDRFDDEIGTFVRKFEYILTNVIDNIDLTLFYNHINCVSFKKEHIRLGDSNLVEYDGVYSLKNNNIIYQNFCDMVMGHEMFHMASSLKIGNHEFIGFMQIDSKEEIGIGVGLNEGYTQMLTERYIAKEDWPRYPLAQCFTKKIEDIVGRDNMEKMYFKADLEGLVSYLEKYNTRDNILRFLNILDVVTNYEKIYNSNMVDKKIIRYFFKIAFKDMSNFLFCTLMNKINIERDNPKFDYKELINMGNSFISEFLGNLYYQNKEYTLLSVFNLLSYSAKVKIKEKFK